MKRLCFGFSGILLSAVLLLPEIFAKAAPVETSAQSAVLLTADTACVLYEKDAHARRAMASTTKIMTALLALEEAERTGDPIVEITEEMVAVEGSSMGLQAGNRISLRGLAVGMMMASGNDAANAAAYFLAGSQEGFAELMNRRAAEIGMKESHFATPSGLDEEGHYSTAYDMALLTREALKNREFARLAASTSCQAEFQEPAQKITYFNHNKLLQQYDGCIGVKTGYTRKAGRCLVSAAERDGVKLIAVTLDAPDDWNDHTAMLEYGFSAVRAVAFDGGGFCAEVPVVGGERSRVTAVASGGISVALAREDADRVTFRVFLPRFLYAPVKPGDKVGKVCYFLDGTELCSVPVSVQEGAELPEAGPGFWKKPGKRKK